MSQSSEPPTRVVCPECNGVVSAPIPGPRSDERGRRDRSRLRGTETNCGNCERDLEVYYY